ncbi:DUF4386 domain-containing protein [Streptomyces sp. WAC07149]|uniref:DUF4386 domain-containing protein n=1 Tax=Streptomyces sp. WAC07149 TaxID=2487425 RepID=UPI000F7A5430|nr:DUF4386 domain-containing protein [Streptomyces sp. WAC07149]RST06189.1 DUF4386 domain-containing protein [Streptomyces sp. WAC07149]
MNADRRTAVTAGVLFLVTEVAAIAGAVLYRPLLGGDGGGAADQRAVLGALCELVLVAAVAGTGVTLYPLVRRWGEGAALGYVCARLLEAVAILLGIVAVLTLATLRRDAADPGAVDAVGAALVAVHDWTFLLGPNIALGVNTALLAGLMYRSRLVPRPIAVLGLVGGPLICASAVAVMSGLYAQLSVPGSVAALPVFAWELALAGRLLLRGFRPEALRWRIDSPPAGDPEPARQPSTITSGSSRGPASAW